MMRKRPTAYAESTELLSVARLPRLIEDWISDGEARFMSDRTIEARREATDRLLWFLRHQEAAECGRREVTAFFAYLRRAHEDPAGRWGNARCTKPLEAASIHKFYRNLKTFFNWLVEQEELAPSPMEKLAPPVLRHDQIQPFSDEQIDALRRAARKAQQSDRAEAILLLLLDTGIRASELCTLQMKGLDLTERECTVSGKGNKRRMIPFSRETAKALYRYLAGRFSDEKRRIPKRPDEPVFLAATGPNAGEALTLSGLEQLIERLGDQAGIQGVRCSPHTFRHSFALRMLNNGANVFALKEMLGHESLTIVNRYLALAEADIKAQHRIASPVENLAKRGRKW